VRRINATFVMELMLIDVSRKVGGTVAGNHIFVWTMVLIRDIERMPIVGPSMAPGS
jgi:hypothetical protein